MYSITPEQAKAFVGKEYKTDVLFNPRYDKLGDWWISEVEVLGCESKDLITIEIIEGLKKTETLKKTFEEYKFIELDENTAKTTTPKDVKY